MYIKYNKKYFSIALICINLLIEMFVFVCCQLIDSVEAVKYGTNFLVFLAAMQILFTLYAFLVIANRMGRVLLIVNSFGQALLLLFFVKGVLLS